MASSQLIDLSNVPTELLIAELNKRIYSKSTIDSQKKTIISIDGCIGAGKTTFLKKLKERFGDKIYFVPEPTRNWSKIVDEDGRSILKLFYGNIPDYAFVFQVLAYITRARALYEAYHNDDYDIIVMERSVETDRHVFAQKMYDDGYITKIQWDIYTMFYDFLNLHISAVLYVDTPVEECDRRIKLRQRPGEEDIPIEYLSSLIQYHENWLNNRPNVHRINGMLDFNNDELLDQTLTYMESLNQVNLDEEYSKLFEEINQTFKTSADLDNIGPGQMIEQFISIYSSLTNFNNGPMARYYEGDLGEDRRQLITNIKDKIIKFFLALDRDKLNDIAADAGLIYSDYAHYAHYVDEEKDRIMSEFANQQRQRQQNNLDNINDLNNNQDDHF